MIDTRSVQRSTLWLQASYWWYFGAIGCFVPYIALYYRGLGLSGVQLGVLVAILPLGTAFLAPLWGALADAFSAHRLVLRIALVAAAASALALTQTRHFVAILLLVVMLALFSPAIPSLLDAYAVTVSERSGRSYGRLRVWGSMGFIGAVWFVGWWMGSQISSFFLVAYAGALLLACAMTFGLPSLQSRPTRRKGSGARDILRNPSVLLLLLTAFLVMSNASIMSNYIGVLVIELGGNAQLVGLTSAAAAMSELPVLVFGTWFLDRFGSRRVLYFAVTVYVVRFMLYSIPPTATGVLAIQLLHGPSFGAYLMASVTLIHQLAGRERAATAQGLLASTTFGFGSITGSLVGGTLLDRMGAVGIFRVAAAGMIVALLVCLVGGRRISETETEAGATLTSNAKASN